MSGAGPPFGRRMLELWALDPSVVYLNHGTVGAPPKRVLQAQQAIRDEIERDPARFLLRELADIGDDLPRAARPRLRAAAERVAEFVGAQGADLVFTDNATTAANAGFRQGADVTQPNSPSIRSRDASWFVRVRSLPTTSPVQSERTTQR